MRTDVNRSRRVKGLIAGAAGAALLLAGGTWALWYDSESIDGQTIKAGNLDLAIVDREYAYDVSTWTGTNNAAHNGLLSDTAGARTDANRNLDTLYPALAADSRFSGMSGHEIDVRSNATNIWSAVPGDKVAVVLPFAVALQGDNLVAELKVTPAAAGTVINNPDVIENMQLGIFLKTAGTWANVLYMNDATFRAALQGTNPWFTQYLQAANEDFGQVEVVSPTYPIVDLAEVPSPLTSADANLVIVVTAEFNPATYNRDAALLDLVSYANVTVDLEQTRDAAVGSF
jgi:predicted ribosomally synthesized peptide with SipW-like signal peptide